MSVYTLKNLRGTKVDWWGTKGWKQNTSWINLTKGEPNLNSPLLFLYLFFFYLSVVCGYWSICSVFCGGGGVVFIYSFVYLPLIKYVMRKNERFFIEIFNKNLNGKK